MGNQIESKRAFTLASFTDTLKPYQNPACNQPPNKTKGGFAMHTTVGDSQIWERNWSERMADCCFWETERRSKELRGTKSLGTREKTLEANMAAESSQGKEAEW